MAETPQTAPGGAASAANQPRLTIQTQYIKDLSFENPRAPASLEPGQGRPEIQVQVDVRATQLDAERYEVVLQLHVDAKSGGETGFVMELVYGGLFGLANIPSESLQALLLIECPRLLFPFARRIIADTTRDGGFPPLMLDPIDFIGLFRRRQQQAEAQARPQGGPQGGGEPVPNPIVGDGQGS